MKASRGIAEGKWRFEGSGGTAETNTATAEGKRRDCCRQKEGLPNASGETVEGKWREFLRKVGGLLKACAGREGTAEGQ